MFDMPGEPEESKIAEMGRRLDLDHSIDNDVDSYLLSSGTRCPRKAVNCKNEKYRSYNGVCNNLKNPYLGMQSY